MRLQLEEFWHLTQIGLRSTVPTVVTLFLVIICVLPYGVPGLNKAVPLLPIVSIYFWSVHRPDLTSLTCHFLIGLFQDIVVGTPIGFSAAIFVGIHAAVHYQRRFFYGRTFIVLWASFSLLMFAVSMLSFMIMGLYNLSFVPFSPVFLQFFLTVAFYPLLIRILQWISRAFLRPV